MMQHTQSFLLTAADFDAHGNILPSRVLSFFQDAAGAHAEELGIGFRAMAARNLLWMVSQIKYKVCASCLPGLPMTITTWPLMPTRMGLKREYLILSADGTPVIKGTSNWLLIDTSTRRLAIPRDIYPNNDFCTDVNFPEKTPRLRDFETTKSPYPVCPDESTIDNNGHVNNTKYADFVLNAVKDFGGKMDTFQIDYFHEVLCREPLQLYHTTEKNTTLVKGISEDNRRMFTCSFTVK